MRNLITPRIFVGATQQDAGKTTVALGLFSALSKRVGRIGFTKPVGQRVVRVEGAMIDEDSLLIDHTFAVRTPLEAMSPIAVEPEFTRQYIDGGDNADLVRRVQAGFDRAAWEKDFCIVEGTGHAGVGSVFDLSNARVARLLQCPVLMVAPGGIGRPIDELALNKALFDGEGVQVLGAILNKVIPSKMESIRDYAGRGLARLGIDLLGVIPMEPILERPALRQVAEVIGGEFLCGAGDDLRRVDRVVIGAAKPSHALEHFSPGTLVITAGDREDVITAALDAFESGDGSNYRIAGMVLAADLRPPRAVLERIARVGLPTIFSPSESYSVASRINKMTIKTLPDDSVKISRIRELVERHVDIDRLAGKIETCFRAPASLGESEPPVDRARGSLST